MATIVTRAGKGSPLTNTEVDANFTNLNTDKVEKSGDTLTGDLAFGDNVKATFGASDDLQIYHSSDSVYLDASNAPNYLFITTGTSGFYLMNPSSNILVELIGDGISLNYNGSSRIVTESTGVSVSGDITVSGDINLPDWDFATSTGQLLIGDSDDLQLYHISGNNYIKSTSPLEILTDTFRLFNGNNTELMILATANGSVDLYYDNAVKLATSSSGVTVTGLLSATTKSFVIDHPTKDGFKLRHGSLEGPENGVYVRGRTQVNIIELPDYWEGLVDEESVTVNITPIGRDQGIYVESWDNQKIVLAGTAIDCFYTVYGERKDVDSFEVEYEE